MKMFYDKDVNPDIIKGMKVAVIGYGSQGHAHALSLKDNGVDVMVGLSEESRSRAKAEAGGLKVGTAEEAAKWGDVVMMLVPDTKAPKIYQDSVEPHLTAGKTLMFGHGFNCHYGTIVPPENVDVSLVAPKAPGHRVRQVFEAGGGTPGLVAIFQDASGNARDIAMSYAWGIGCTRAGVIETTFKDETETDLFGEQAVLCGGTAALVKAGFEVLVERGYPAEMAYFECMHELKLIVDLMYQGGLNYMRYSISDTAEVGDYWAGPRIITEQTKHEMHTLLDEIQDGSFAKKWIAENENGRPEFLKDRARDQDHLIEKVGAQLREMMPFINPVTVKPGE